MSKKLDEEMDVAAIGAGFGGLGATLALAEAGRSPVLFERLNYPGGCAATFTKRGLRYEAGATLFSGFDPGQLFHRWIERYDLPVVIHRHDPLVEFRSPLGGLRVPPDRAAYLDQVLALPGTPEAATRAYFAHQKQVADGLWELLDRPELLPPIRSLGALVRHARRLPAYWPLLRDLGRPLSAVLDRFGLRDAHALRLWLDASCQITVQCGLEEADAVFAQATLDYYFRGTGHVEGGIGVLAEALCRAITQAGGEVRFTDEVKAIRELDAGAGYELQTRRGTHRCRSLVCNTLPNWIADKLDARGPMKGIAPLAERVAQGWGAVMLYLDLDAEQLPSPDGLHIQIVQDHQQALRDGNHLFLSVGSGVQRNLDGQAIRTATVSTHVSIPTLRALPEEARGEHIQGIQGRMREGLRLHAADWTSATVRDMPGSPRTFERFTGRPEGLVGGIPRTAGWSGYLDLIRAPLQPRPRLHLVGDSVFPGQSTLATALGGLKTAERIGP